MTALVHLWTMRKLVAERTALRVLWWAATPQFACGGGYDHLAYRSGLLVDPVYVPAAATPEEGARILLAEWRLATGEGS